ncbi:MAG: hypothetical protein ACTSX7_07675 [Alphaproteobacteria bacterium]
MAKILRNLMLALFVSKKNRATAGAALDRRSNVRAHGRAAVDRSDIIKQALATRQQKEHLWTELSEEQREELMGSLGDGMRDKIAAMQTGAKKAG